MSSVLINENPYLDVAQYFMVIVGMWPINQIRHQVVKAIYSVFRPIPRIYLTLFICTQFIDIPILIMQNDMAAVAEDLGLAITYIFNIAKILKFTSSKVKMMYTTIENTSKKILKSQDDELKTIFKRNCKSASRHQLFYVAFSLVIIATFDVTTYIEFYVNYHKKLAANLTYSRPLPFVSWFPFNTDVHYTPAYIIHLITCHYGGYFYIVTQSLLMGLIIFVSGQFDILIHFFKNLQYYTETVQKDYGYNKDDAAFAVVRFCVQEHQKIINFTRDLNDSIMYIILLEFMLNSLLIASLCIQIAEIEITIVILFTVVYSLLMLSHVFILFWHSNEIKLKSIQVGDAIYESNWFDQSSLVKKALLLILMRTDRHCALTCGPFAEASTASIISILKGSYSYMMLMMETGD